MKNRTKNSTTPTAVLTLASIKRQLREWYGVISIKEIINNKALIFEIEVLEKMLVSQGV